MPRTRARTALQSIAPVVALCLVAAIMRPAITAVGPLIDGMSADTGIPITALGALPTIVLVTWAAVSPFAHAIGRRLGLGSAVLASLGLLGAGLVVRSMPGSPSWLWAGTLTIGVSIAIGNVLLPSFVKRDFPGRVPLMMGLYSGILGGAGALASGVAVPLDDLVTVSAGQAGWRTALLITGGVALPFAAAAWWFATRGKTAGEGAATSSRAGIWRDAIAWQVAMYMGLQSTCFFVLVTWIATLSMATGRSAATAGADVMVYQVFSLAGSLLVAFGMRGRGSRLTPALLPLVGLLGTAGMMAWPQGVALWVIPLGAFSGASLGVALTLMAQRAPDHGTSSALSGMSQSIGYALAAIGPVLFGALYTTFGNAALVILLVATAALSAFGALAGRDRYVRADGPRAPGERARDGRA